MRSTSALAAFARRLGERLSQPAAWKPLQEDSAFGALALELFHLQLAHNAAYRRYCEQLGGSATTPTRWRDLPAVPTAAFKKLELTSLAPSERSAVFHSSGTSAQRPSRHFHSAESLALYEAALLAWFRPHLLGASDALDRIFLTPSSALAPHSSLVHMFETIRRDWGGGHAEFVGRLADDNAWTVDVPRVCTLLSEAVTRARPISVFGTAFNFVHLLDALTERDARFPLPPGSRVMETGGYKGRSRSLSKVALHALIEERLGVPSARIVCEYGMSELSSQAYDYCCGDSGAAPRGFRFPPWARATVISPETAREVAEGETGRLRLVDLANVWSVLAVQTEDLAVRRGVGFELLGRAPAAEPRGCSLQAI